MKSIHYENEFALLTKNLDLFIDQVKKKKSNLMATDKWTVKGVLCHIVFWHENYAANYKALAENSRPPLFDAPGYKLNIDGVLSLRRFSIKTLVSRLYKAQNSLYTSIVQKGVPKMTYKKDGHVYTTPDFLRVIATHLLTHSGHVRRAK